jgi:hypothetical protein
VNQQQRLQKAVDNEPVPRDLEARVRTRLGRSPRRGTSGWGRLASSIALLVFMLGGTQYYVVTKTRELLRVGLDDHVHCAIEGEYPRQTSKAAGIEALGPYSPMLQPVLDQLAGDSLVSAHRCTVNGRDYVHMILRRNNMLISVIMTRREKADAFPRAIGMRTFEASGIPVHGGDMSGYAVAGFEAGNYLGYVVSGLPGQQNDQLAGRVAPVIRRYTGA